VCLYLGLLLTSVAVVNAQADKPLPTNDEINLLLTQADRAIQQYEPLIDQEETQMGKTYVQAVANDRHVVDALETAVKAFKSKPQAFNGPLGFVFFA
jgi:cell division protein FtsL